jgi:hypothetical protein
MTTVKVPIEISAIVLCAFIGMTQLLPGEMDAQAAQGVTGRGGTCQCCREMNCIKINIGGENPCGNESMVVDTETADDEDCNCSTQQNAACNQSISLAELQKAAQRYR